jgi:hypothetical protein
VRNGANPRRREHTLQLAGPASSHGDGVLLRKKIPTALYRNRTARSEPKKNQNPKAAQVNQLPPKPNLILIIANASRTWGGQRGQLRGSPTPVRGSPTALPSRFGVRALQACQRRKGENLCTKFTLPLSTLGAQSLHCRSLPLEHKVYTAALSLWNGRRAWDDQEDLSQRPHGGAPPRLHRRHGRGGPVPWTAPILLRRSSTGPVLQSTPWFPGPPRSSRPSSLVLPLLLRPFSGYLLPGECRC